MLLKLNFIIGLLIGIQFLETGLTLDIDVKQQTYDIRLFINRINRKMFILYDEIHRLTFDPNKFENQPDLNAIQIGTKIDEIASLIKESQTFQLEKIEHPNLRLAIENINKSAYLYILGSEKYNELTDILDRMMLPALKKKICEYRNTLKCDLFYIPDISNKIAAHPYKSDQLRYYWSEWRTGIEKDIRPILPNFINLFRMAANETGVNPIEFLYNYYNGDLTIINDMKNVMDELMPFYKEFHGYVRHELNIYYGNETVPITGPIPDHVFQVVLLQAWKKNSILKQPYPDQRLPNLKGELQKKIISPQSMISSSENYYASFGITPFPNKIRSENFKRKYDNELGSHCKAEIYDETPNVLMEFCPQVNIKKFLQMHGYLGRMHYAYKKRNLPFHYFKSYKFENAVGEAIILSASSPEHLANLKIISNLTSYTTELDMNRLFRMGVHTLFNIPTYYVHLKLFEDVLTGTTNLTNINVHYWNLMEKYAGIEPPIDRNIEALDLSYKFFEDLKSNQLVTKFVSEILGYQFYESLCILTGKYGDTVPEKQLHNCNLEGHQKVGEILNTMMESGSKKSWRETLTMVTGNFNGLSAKGILNYYAELRKWLQQQIQEKQINIGWNPSSKVLNVRIDEPR